MIRQDLKTYNLSVGRCILSLFRGHSIGAIINYRIGNWFYRHHIKVLPDIFCYCNIKKHCCEISPYASIGTGVRLHHTIGIIIGHSVRIGNNCEIFQHVTIGSNRRGEYAYYW